MHTKNKPQCLKCERMESAIWFNKENGVICVVCNTEKEEPKKDELLVKGKMETSCSKEDSKRGRRGIRTTRYCKTRLNPFALPKQLASKGKGRRGKKQPIKAPSAVATPVTSESVFFKGSYIQIGDIVSMIDENDDIYYAQIRGLLTDQYCEKSAVITWLLPTQESRPPEEGFDPATYVIGPDEEIPRKLDCMEFVMHAPSEYFKARNTPYPAIYTHPEPGFIWTTLYPIRS